MRRFFALMLPVALSLGPLACGDDEDVEPTPERPREDVTDPGPLLAGIADLKLPVPVGIGTMGNSPFGQEESVSPFAEVYPATKRQHTAIRLRAVALSRGPGHELILVRSDTIGVFQQLREAVLDELERRTGRDLDHALILAGNHTHSGPGRILMTEGPLTLLGDTFLPVFYDRMVQSVADVVEAALADLAPAELGAGQASRDDAHNDRRCENDALDQRQKVSDLPLVAVRRQGRVDAVIGSFAYHGTVIGIGDLTLSGDIGIVIEEKIAERFDHPVSVLFLTSWAGDMAPGDAMLDGAPEASPQPGGYDRMEAVGARLADVVVPVVSSMVFDAEPTVRARTYRTRLDREVLGYDDETFYYPDGAVYCGLGSPGNCEDATPIENLDFVCIGFRPEEQIPKQTLFTAGVIGPLAFVTAPGEWSTELANGTLDLVREHSGMQAMFIGYANDYSGYSLNEDDWWQGGYEAAGSMWGPKQGDYLAARAAEAFETMFDFYLEPPYEVPAPTPPFSGYTVVPYVPEAGVDVGTVVEDVAEAPAPTDVVTLRVLGSDPWLGTPVATLEREEGGAFSPVLRPNGTPITSDEHEMWIDLDVNPPYAELMPAAERAFYWTVHLPVSRRAPSASPPLSGTYRLSVRIPTGGGGTAVVESQSFTLP